MRQLYADVAAYGVNTFASPALSDLSPFESVFVHKPPDLLNLAFPPLEQFSSLHKDYLQLLKEKIRICSWHFARILNQTATTFCT